MSPSMRPRICSISRGVNAFCTRPRSRVWSGGSRLSMLRLSDANTLAKPGPVARAAPGVKAFAASLTNRSSFRTIATSS